MRQMAVIAPFLLLVCAQGSVAGPSSSQEQHVCKYSAEHMIEVAKQSLSDKNARPERVEKRRKLVEDWTSRMEEGEDPCTVYADIQKVANTF